MCDLDVFIEYDDEINDDVTYNDVINKIIDYNKSISKDNNIELLSIYDDVVEIVYFIETEKEYLDNVINVIWDSIMEPIIEFETVHTLKKDIVRIKHGFTQWLYNNTCVGEKINYIHNLLNILENKIKVENIQLNLNKHSSQIL